MILRSDLDLALSSMAEAEALLNTARIAQTRAFDALQSAVNGGLNSLSPGAWPTQITAAFIVPGDHPGLKAAPNFKPSSSPV